TAMEIFDEREHASILLEPVNTKIFVLGDTCQLERMFSNIIENAIRYTHKTGEIRLRAVEEDNHVNVTIEDNGAGIPAEHLPHVRERFYRVDDSRTRGAGGAGLGLSICQSIIDAHGGSMTIESIAGYGTTVRVSLRRALADKCTRTAN